MADTDRTKQDGDKWEENKESKEILAIFNFKKSSAHFLKATVTVNDAQRQLLDNA